MEAAAYERLGGTEGIASISADLVRRHLANPSIQMRFAASGVDSLTKPVTDFLGMGTGGPAVCAGRDMPSAHETLAVTRSATATPSAFLVAARTGVALSVAWFRVALLPLRL